MKNSGDDIPAKLSDEALLRFLDRGSLKGVRHSREHAFDQTDAESEFGLGHEPNPQSGKFHENTLNACPARGSYMRVVLGTIEDQQAQELLSHVTNCPDCEMLLARALRTLEGEPSQEEAAAIAELAASRADWQRDLARQLATTSAQRVPASMRRASFGQPKRWEFSPGSLSVSRWRLMAGAGLAAALISVATFAVWQWRTNTPDRQLALAYEQLRTLELRIPEAAYTAFTPSSHTRGSLADHEPAQLLEARARLARELERAPQDVHWLQLQARADVLEERYDSAADVLDRLLATGPVTSDLLVDAASAYYQRGLVAGNDLDRSTALDYLRRADELTPTDPVVLFNEAIVMEDRGQMMNAVEVWNRYCTVERDPKWVAEGKRKLAALEETLNRLKSHESRIRRMLASPEAMLALAADENRLAALDEELSSIQLDKLLPIAYPAPTQSAKSGSNRHSVPGDVSNARGSPCDASCLASRRLLKAVGLSLELHHHDFWLSDLLSLDPESLPPAPAASFIQALRLLSQATREDQTGDPSNGAWMAGQALAILRRLNSSSVPGYPHGAALHVALDRTAIEYMFAMQRQVNFTDCRKFALQAHAELHPLDADRYPWLESLALTTEKVCDDTPETRRVGQTLQTRAMQLAKANGYRLLTARILALVSTDAINAHDPETAERLALATLHDLYAADTPAVRIFNTVGIMSYAESDSGRPRMEEACLLEFFGWLDLAGNRTSIPPLRMDLARVEMRFGATKKAERQLQLAKEELRGLRLDGSQSSEFVEEDIYLANSMLERGDGSGASLYLDLVEKSRSQFSDALELRAYAAARGLLELKLGHLDAAAHALESEIRSSEGKNVQSSDRVAAVEYASQDHDIYAELTAVWLEQGRPPGSVLALWERFRVRSLGLPVRACAGTALDCDRPAIEASQRRLGDSILIGQVLLLDRTLVYRVDRNEIHWTERPVLRKDVLDREQALERAVSSPYTSFDTAAELGTHLAAALLPQLPANVNSDAELVLEPDTMLRNLPWPVLPTPSGPLGLRYPLEEQGSMLKVAGRHSDHDFGTRAGSGDHALVIGSSVAAGGGAPLPEALDEARSVGQILKTSRVLLGEHATVSHVAQALGTATIFHFSGHAAQTQDGTELLMAADPGDQTPWVDGAFLRLHPPRVCRLAVLSACATGKHESSWNHPLQDMVETLGSLGVPEVVATRWQIDSEASVPFIHEFYTRLAQGDSVASALTAARRLQFQQSLYSNPYYWGAYYVTRREAIYPGGKRNGQEQVGKEAKGKS
jgi:tetratricopeptide (TPR) repeat protein